MVKGTSWEILQKLEGFSQGKSMKPI
jgi:hypothetical protein